MTEFLRFQLVFIYASFFLSWQFVIASFTYALPTKESFIAKLQQDSPAWMNEQIQKDFTLFREGIDLKALEDIYLSSDHSSMLLVYFKVVNNQLYFDNSSDWTGRSEAIRQALLFLIETVGLPNLDLVMTMHDSIPPMIKGPILTFAKTKDINSGILIPDCEALLDYTERFPYDSLQTYNWKDKEKKAFWRGSTTGAVYIKKSWFLIPRSQLVLLSLQRPDLVDAKFTNVVQSEQGIAEILSIYNLLDNHVSVSDHLRYRYLVDIDGNSCTYSRCYWILLSNSLLLKQVSENIQWYYEGLIPFQHYVPLKSDISDIFEKVEWAKTHDQEAEKISRHATEFARQSLSVENIYIYLYKVLQKYASLQKENTSITST